jgi:hypothetical protein
VSKPLKIVPVVLRSNHRSWFWDSTKNLRSSSPCARCRPHTTSFNILIVRPPSIQPVRPFMILYISSPTSATIPVTSRHVAHAICTSWNKQMWFSKRNKDKGKIIKMSRIRIQTLPSQWLITIKPRILNFYLSLEHLQQFPKKQLLKSWI